MTLRQSRVILTHLVHTSTRDDAASPSRSSHPHLGPPSESTHGRTATASRLAPPHTMVTMAPSSRPHPPHRSSTHGDDGASPLSRPHPRPPPTSRTATASRLAPPHTTAMTAPSSRPHPPCMPLHTRQRWHLALILSLHMRQLGQ